jgi:hypothetical protein
LLLGVLPCPHRHAPPEAIAPSSILLIIVAHAEALRSWRAAGYRRISFEPNISACTQQQFPSAE